MPLVESILSLLALFVLCGAVWALVNWRTQRVDPAPVAGKFPRMFFCSALTLAALVGMALVKPALVFTIVYKLTLLLVAAVLGYYIDRWVYPYARPDSYLDKDWRYSVVKGQGVTGQPDYPTPSPALYLPFTASQHRRAIIIAAAMVAMGLGL